MNVETVGMNDLYYVMTSDSLHIGESMESLRSFPHLQGNLKVLSGSLFAVDSTLYKNMFGQSQPVAAESGSSMFNNILIVIGVLIVCFFLYNIYSVKT